MLDLKSICIADLLHPQGISKRTINVCEQNGCNTLHDILQVSELVMSTWRGCGTKVMSELGRLRAELTFPETVIPGASILEKCQINETTSQMECAIAFENEYHTLSPKRRLDLKIQYNNLLTAMSVRAQNVFRPFFDLDKAIGYVSKRLIFNKYEFASCGDKTELEILNVIKTIRENIVSAINNRSQEPQDDTLAYHSTVLQLRFPFLTEFENHKLAAGLTEGRKLPAVFLISKFIERSELQASRIYKTFYCLGNTTQADEVPTLQNVAELFDLTRERVRQILTSPIKLPAAFDDLKNEITEALAANLISQHDDVFKQFSAGAPELSPRQIGAILSSVNSDYTLIEFDPASTVYLVKKALLDGVRLFGSYRRLIHDIEISRETAYDYSLLDIIRQESAPANLHEQISDIFPLFFNAISHYQNVKIGENGQITILPNRMDYIALVEKILEDNGSQMTAVEIYEEAQRRCTCAQLPQMQSFKIYIFNNPRIAAVGKSGKYVLKDWENVFTGNILDYVERLLTESEGPMHISDIVAEAKNTFENTSVASIQSLISIHDAAGRFAKFGSGYYGLKNRHYLDIKEYMKPKYITRECFAVRFMQFKEFVSTHHRWPFAANDQEETQLLRWHNNVQGRRINTTGGEMADFAYYCLDNFLLPRNSSELDFLNNCEQCKTYYAEQGHLPPSSHPLGAWLKKISSKKLTPRKSAYLQELKNVCDKQINLFSI